MYVCMYVYIYIYIYMYINKTIYIYICSRAVLVAHPPAGARAVAMKPGAREFTVMLRLPTL